jgi:hypothetical protein
MPPTLSQPQYSHSTQQPVCTPGRLHVRLEVAPEGGHALHQDVLIYTCFMLH